MKGDTREKVGKALGIAGSTYGKAKKVVEAAEDVGPFDAGAGDTEALASFGDGLAGVRRFGLNPPVI